MDSVSVDRVVCLGDYERYYYPYTHKILIPQCSSKWKSTRRENHILWCDFIFHRINILKLWINQYLLKSSDPATIRMFCTCTLAQRTRLELHPYRSFVHSFIRIRKDISSIKFSNTCSKILLHFLPHFLSFLLSLRKMEQSLFVQYMHYCRNGPQYLNPNKLKSVSHSMRRERENLLKWREKSAK